MRMLLMALLLAGCTGEPAVTPEGCPIYYGELMSIATESCVQNARIEAARQRGAAVTTCYRSSTGSTCVTE